jgi:hypothetical protein
VQALYRFYDADKLDPFAGAPHGDDTRILAFYRALLHFPGIDIHIKNGCIHRLADDLLDEFVLR